MPGAVAPGTPARISSVAAGSRRDAPTVLLLAGTSHTSVRGDLSPLEYRNDQPSPRRGGSPPPSRGLSPLLPLPPRGRGRSAKRGRGRGAALQSITSNWGRKITHLYNLGCFNSILFTHMRVNRFFSGKMFIMVGVLLSTTV